MPGPFAPLPRPAVLGPGRAFMITVCAWCLPKRVMLSDDGKGDGVISLGMCERHLAEWRATARALFAVREERELRHPILPERRAA